MHWHSIIQIAVEQHPRGTNAKVMSMFHTWVCLCIKEVLKVRYPSNLGPWIRRSSVVGWQK